VTTNSIPASSLRLTPLSACLALAFAGGALATTGADKALPMGLHAATRMQLLTSRPRHAHPQQRAQAPGPAATDQVMNCLDNGSPGSLRKVVMGAASGDTINLSGLTSCAGSKITLLLGEIAVPQADLTFTGPPLLPNGSPALTIDANLNGRAIDATTGTLEINNLAIINGKFNVDDDVASGGCLYSHSDVTLTNSSVFHCTVSGSRASGGGIYSFGAVTVVNSTVSNNTATATSTAVGTETSVQASGGGIYSYYAATLTNSTVSGNHAVVGTIADPVLTAAAYTFGGGISIAPGQQSYPYANTITGSTISGNSAQYGGGIYAFGHLTLSNSTFSGNSATLAGGGVHARHASDLTLQNSTVAFNSSVSIGGVVAPPAGMGPTLTINSTIVSNNSATDPTHAADLGAFAAINVSGANSLITSSDAVITFANAPLTADPVLLALAGNGGPTKTHALDPTSPAIDAGNDTALLTTDQRGAGFPRTSGAATDIGAYEVTIITDRIFANGFE
jgi:hypothetical protein